ncbi:MAG: hypothetical protein PHN55_03280 [Dysgonamonadaceae bacterium]|nr:hypothetical protein [Dysgonamonadaceae bacterium]
MNHLKQRLSNKEFQIFNIFTSCYWCIVFQNKIYLKEIANILNPAHPRPARANYSSPRQRLGYMNTTPPCALKVAT